VKTNNFIYIFLAASTHPGEEEILIKLANNLRSKGIDNILIIITN